MARTSDTWGSFRRPDRELIVNSARACLGVTRTALALGTLLALDGPAAHAQPAVPAAKPAAAAAPAAPAAKPATAAAPSPAAPAAKPAAAATAAAKPAATTTQAPAAAVAAPAAAKPAPAKPPSFSQVLADLASTDRARVEAALTVLEAKPEPRGVGPLAARIREGLPPELVLRGIRILAANKGGSSPTALRELLGHRRPEVRKAAAEALATQGAKSQGKALLPLLDDPDAKVRSAALAALATLGERRALEPAFAAVENGSSDAAVLCIARLAQPADLERLVGLASQRPFGVLQPAFELVLERKDFPPRGKLDLVAKIGALGTPPAQDYLRDYLTRVPETGKKPMMVAIGKALAGPGMGASTSASTRTTTGTGTGTGTEKVADKDKVKP